MMPASSFGAFQVGVHTTSHRGATPEEVAERCLNKILHVSDSAPEPLRAQAEAYRVQLRRVLVLYMQEAVQSDRATLSERLKERGLPEIAEIIRSL